MRIITIPKDEYDEYRLDLIFNCYKWDPQFLDSNTVAKHVLVLTEKEHEELRRLTEAIDKETREAEETINKNFEISKKLSFPSSISKELSKMQNYDSSKHVRLMRYDFHPTEDGSWAVSEVNSDVPGGFAEATLIPQYAINLFSKYGMENLYSINFGNIIVNALKSKVKKNGRIMMVHCTSYSDDRQVMQFLGDELKKEGFDVLYGAADHIRFEDGKAYSILSGKEGELDGIVRFTPLEWFKTLKPKMWQGYFNTITPSCNHPISMFAQTKKFPLVWPELEKLGVNLEYWKKLLPDTVESKNCPDEETYIYKPACGRVGEGISIKEACIDDEFEKIMKSVKRHPNDFIAQKKFISKPVISDEGEEFHTCIGSYTVDGKHAGYYARISPLPRIDSNAADISVVIERSTSNDK